MIAQLLIGATLAWDPSPTPTVVGYRLYQKDNAGHSYSVIGTTSGTTLSSQILDGVTYTWMVTAYTASGLESDPSNEVSYTARPQVRIEGHTITIFMVEGLQYEIQYTNDFLTWSVLRTEFITGAPRDQSFVDPSLDNHRFYRVKITVRVPAILSKTLAVESIPQLPPLPSIFHRKKPWWNLFRYKPGLHPSYEKGAQKLMNSRSKK